MANLSRGNPGPASLELKCRIRLPANFRSANLVMELAAEVGAIDLTVANVRREERLSRDFRGRQLELVPAETTITDHLLDINRLSFRANRFQSTSARGERHRSQ